MFGVPDLVLGSSTGLAVSDPGYLALDMLAAVLCCANAQTRERGGLLNPTFKYLRNSAAVGGRELNLLATLSPNSHGS